MQPLTHADLMSLEQYSRERAAFRRRAMEQRRVRRLVIGPHCTWNFEDRLTIQYQLLEMLRAERIFEHDAIREELETYNPLIPDGHNLKATLLIEYPDAQERVQRLAELRGFERQCWMRAAGHDRIAAIADEDLPRENDEKTSAVHFLRFEFTPVMIGALAAGAALAAGVDHPAYRYSVDPVPEPQRSALLADFDPR